METTNLSEQVQVDKKECFTEQPIIKSNGNLKLFRFKTEMKKQHEIVKPFQISPLVNIDNEQYCNPVQKTTRKIPKMPFKVLDAPLLQDDFYLNLVDWSPSNILAVGLGPAVYIWSACTSKVTKLCEVPENDAITSVSWS